MILHYNGVLMLTALLLASAAATAPATAPPPETLPEPMSFEDSARARLTLNEPGMLYLVDFWAEGCKGCIEEIPDLERLAREFEKTGRFRLISVLWGGWSGEELHKFAKRYNITHPMHSDPDDWVGKLGGPAFPLKLLVRDGRILKRHVGGARGSYYKWKPLIAEELAAKASEAP